MRVYVRWLLAFLSVGAFSTASAYHFEVGRETLPNGYVTLNWHTVTFDQPFDDVPVVISILTLDGADPAHVRIRNVTRFGFEAVTVEPDPEDGPHTWEPVGYLAIDQGVHQLPDGTRIVAFTHDTTSQVGRSVGNTWDNVAIPGGFGATPALVGTVQSFRNEVLTPPGTPSQPFLGTAIRNVTAGGLETSLERAETSTGSVLVPETIGYVALPDRTNTIFTEIGGASVQLQSMVTPRNVVGYDNGCVFNNWPVAFSTTPIAVASMNSRHGGDGGWFRECGLSATAYGLLVDEDRARDTERRHTREFGSAIAASRAFHAIFNATLEVAKSVAAIADPTGSGTPKSVPGAVHEYRIRVLNDESVNTDPNSLQVVDFLPAEVALCVSVTCFPGGPVVFDDSGSPVPSGVVISSIEYSADGGATFTHVPNPDAAGYDTAVNALRVSLSGDLATGSLTVHPLFDLLFRTRLR